ncbi:hypothetical protein AGRO_0011 [Agrobacterium sp. ATCC 31749]|nr:hypothetical protein AGRO_0011 [Agrobacterium sp. ATCC 31749]
MAFAVRVCDQHETTSGNMADLAVAGFVHNRTVKPNCKYWLRYPMPCNFSHPCWDVSDADARGGITGCYVKWNGVGMDRYLCCWQFDFIEVRLTIG